MAHRITWAWGMAGMNGEALVEKYGVTVAGRIYPSKAGDDVGFYVDESQAAWAEYVLIRAGYALTSRLYDQSNYKQMERAYREGASRPAGGSKRVKRHGFVDRLHHALDEVVSVGAKGRERIMPQQTTREKTTLFQPGSKPASKPARSILDSLAGLFGGGSSRKSATAKKRKRDQRSNG
ncbi:MAG: hypothetical protein KDD77_20555 [Caldilineaceae bacterium]|nr:hypothetical protein [Caldilineaceae bacterium]